jgi:hypothetical protein
MHLVLCSPVTSSRILVVWCLTSSIPGHGGRGFGEEAGENGSGKVLELGRRRFDFGGDFDCEFGRHVQAIFDLKRGAKSQRLYLSFCYGVNTVNCVQQNRGKLELRF